MPSHVFISHSSADKETAAKMVAVLEARGIPCWVAPRDIQPGSNYAASIIEGIERARAMIFIVSEHLNASHQVPREAERAVNKDIPVIPVRIENVKLNKSLEYFFSSAQWFDAFPPPVEAHLERLAGSLQYLFESASAADEKAALGMPVPTARRDSTRTSKAKKVGVPIIVGALATIAVVGGIILISKTKPPTNQAAESPAAAPAVAASPRAGASAPPEKEQLVAQSPAPIQTATPPALRSDAAREGENFVVRSIGMPMTWVAPLNGWVGTHEVTQEEFAKAGQFVSSRYPGAKRPADSVSWDDAMKFCAALNRMEKEGGRLPPGWIYTLPTDEQWKTYVGDSGLANAVFGRTEKEGTAEICSKPPNVFGLCDVIGNVWEWTLDWHPRKVGKERALRGGSFASHKEELLLADARYSGSPSNRYELYGFRCILVKAPNNESAQ